MAECYVEPTRTFVNREADQACGCAANRCGCPQNRIGCPQNNCGCAPTRCGCPCASTQNRCGCPCANTQNRCGCPNGASTAGNSCGVVDGRGILEYFGITSQFPAGVMNHSCDYNRINNCGKGCGCR